MNKNKGNYLSHSVLTEIVVPILTVLLFFIARVIISNQIGLQAEGYLNIALLPILFIEYLLFKQFENAETHLIRTRIQKEQVKNSGQVLKFTMFLSCMFGLCFAAIAFFGSLFFSKLILGEGSGSLCFQYTSLIYLLIPCVSSIYGYFRGNHKDYVVSYNRCLFMIFFLIAVLFFSKQLGSYGVQVAKFLRKDTYVDAYCAAGAGFGILFACFLSLLSTFICFLISKNSFRIRLKKDTTKLKEHPFQLCKLLFSSMTTNLLIVLIVILPLVIQILFILIVSKQGQDSAVLIREYGLFFGRFCTILLLPFLYSSLLSANVSGRVEEYYLQKDIGKLKAFCGGEMNLQASFSAIVGALMMVMAKPLCQMLYGAVVSDELVLYVRLGGVLVITAILSFTSSRLMKGIRRRRQQMIVLLLSAVLQLAVGILCSFAFHLGFLGILISEIVFTVVLLILNTRLLAKYVKYHQEWIHSLAFPLVIAVVLSFVGWGLTILLDSPLGVVFSSVLSILLVVTGYCYVLFRFIGYRRKEIILVPGGKIVLMLIRFCS